jgi:hypothetical protein
VCIHRPSQHFCNDMIQHRVAWVGVQFRQPSSWLSIIAYHERVQDMTPYLQQLILHGALDSVEDQKWLSKDSVVSSYLKVSHSSHACFSTRHGAHDWHLSQDQIPVTGSNSCVKEMIGVVSV